MVKIAPDKSLSQTKNRGQRLTLTGDAAGDELMRLLTPDTALIGAVDNGIGGDLLAGRLAKLAAIAAVRFDRLRPTKKGWNQQLCEM